MVPPRHGKNHNLKMNRISRITINGSRSADSISGQGTAVIFGRDVLIQDSEITRNQLDGVMIAESHRVTVKGCLAEGNGGAGIAQETIAGRAAAIRGGHIHSNDRFPDPNGFVKSATELYYKINLWQHAFTNPASPLFDESEPCSGNFGLWNGLVPDFAGGQARKAFGAYHGKNLIDMDVSGFKLDECDNSDFTGGWSFPDCNSFPSGIDGEQMHSVSGLRYQMAIATNFVIAAKRLMAWSAPEARWLPHIRLCSTAIPTITGYTFALSSTPDSGHCFGAPK
jgi:hypothetical protein